MRVEGEKNYDVFNTMVDAMQGMGECDKDEDTNYVFEMDNYFTLYNEIGESNLWGKGDGCVCTARFCTG